MRLSMSTAKNLSEVSLTQMNSFSAVSIFGFLVISAGINNTGEKCCDDRGLFFLQNCKNWPLSKQLIFIGCKYFYKAAFESCGLELCSSGGLRGAG